MPPYWFCMFSGINQGKKRERRMTGIHLPAILSVSFGSLCLPAPAGGIGAGGDEAAVNALLRHKFVVVAGLDDAPLVDNQDLIGVTNGIEPVGNDQQGLAPAQLGDGLLDVALVVGVHAGSGLIQNDDGSILQNAASNGDSLPLSAG